VSVFLSCLFTVFQTGHFIL